MVMLQKSDAPFEVKSVNEKARTFSGLASTWDLDLDDDVIDSAAFDRTLADWRAARGRRIIPLVDQHNYESIRRVFGKLEDARPTSAGLSTTFSIVKSPEGDEYLSRIKGGYVNALSIGFATKKAADERRTVDGNPRQVRVIKELELREISCVVWPAQPNALIDATKRRQLGLAPDDPERLEVEARIRAIRLAGLTDYSR